jgi:geranylgeranyl pyrophosphate synthase
MDDALRRGRATSHVVHGDGLAILAGDALLTDAFRVLAAVPAPAVPDSASVGVMPAGRRSSDTASAHAGRQLDAIARLAAAAGAAGMVGGQAIDLAAAGRVVGVGRRTPDPVALEDMHARKTGAMIRAATTIGAVLVGARATVVGAIDEYARDVGLAFQIIDDVLDVESTDAALGKTAGKDAAAGKPTYPSRYGVEESRRLAAECVTRAQAAVARVGLAGRLGEIAEWTLTRTK